jgi:L-alanine-DL-glutamate epimerase-like enolase superfamily enzyme
MIDLNGRWDLPTALRAAPALEELGISVRRGAAAGRQLADTAALAQRTSVPLAGRKTRRACRTSCG